MTGVQTCALPIFGFTALSDLYLYLFPPVQVGWTLLEEDHTAEWRIKGGVLSEDGRRVLRGPYTPVIYDGECQSRTREDRAWRRASADLRGRIALLSRPQNR